MKRLILLTLALLVLGTTGGLSPLGPATVFTWHGFSTRAEQAWGLSAPFTDFANARWLPLSRQPRRIGTSTCSTWVENPCHGVAIRRCGAKAPLDPSTSQAGRFAAIDIYIDPQGKPLAAYQFELSARNGDVTLVGVEGGEHAAFAPPPYYDPHANLERRIVIAAFNTGPDLPSGKTRVARLMVRIGGTAEPQYIARLQVAASKDADSIPATINVTEGVPQ